VARVALRAVADEAGAEVVRPESMALVE